MDTTRLGGMGAGGGFGVESGIGWVAGVAGVGESLVSESGSSVSPGGIAGAGEPGTRCPFSFVSAVARLIGLPKVEPMSVEVVEAGGGVGDLRPSAVRSRSTAW